MNYLSRSQLDAVAYDRCISESPNRIAYAFSWYLDAVSPGWECLVEGNYEAVMPLPVRHRYGVKAVIQPLFCHQLGVFCRTTVPDGAIISRFWEALQQHIQYVPSYQVNAAHTALLTEKTAHIPLTNHVLALNRPYEELWRAYSEGRRKNIRRAVKSGRWTFEDTTDIEPLIDLFARYNTTTIGRVAPNAYDLLRQLTRALHEQNRLWLRVARHNGRIEAGNLLVVDEHRLIHLFCAASPLGRVENCRAVIADDFIRHYANRPMLFDFESPEAEGMVTFNQRFGTTPEGYARLNYNRLPMMVQWLHSLKKRLQNA